MSFQTSKTLRGLQDLEERLKSAQVGKWYLLMPSLNINPVALYNILKIIDPLHFSLWVLGNFTYTPLVEI